jgi:4-hydroxy-3-methylbut-2-en-1-yl diphosphate reductase
MSHLDIKVSASAGYCWGVERALELARTAAAEAPGPINTLGPIIHNPGVIAELADQGIGVIASPEEAASGTVILRSHGVTREVREQLDASGLSVLDATCRFVKAAQEKAAHLSAQGYLVVILGETDHPEVLGLRSYAGPDSIVVERPDDLPDTLPSWKVGVVVQTTQSQGRLADLVAHLAPRTRELLVYNTICGATEQRQTAAVAMAQEVDLVIVVGGRNSGNTRRLADLCSVVQPHTHHVETPAELDPAWFQGVRSVGITAGASTPPDQIDAVANRIREIDP